MAIIMFLIIFMWTPPHFWALALAKKDEYAAAKIPMLPVTHGDNFTRIHITIHINDECMLLSTFFNWFFRKILFIWFNRIKSIFCI